MFSGFFRRSWRIFLFALALATGRVQAQSCHLRVSLLTCASGEDLYATFGHSAIRVIDSTDGGDYVFNYGTFDTDTPHFYWKFVRGRLLYCLSASDYPSFMAEYYDEKRKVTEQVLDLSCAEKQAVWDFLRENYRPENRYYKYDFLFDNCATRIRDLFSRVLGKAWSVPDVIPEKGITFREIINGYLQDKPWERLGINLMFGKSTDRAIRPPEIMFLPRYLETALDSATLSGSPVVKEKKTVYDPGPASAPGYPFTGQPLLWCSLLALIVVLLSFRPGRAGRAVLPWVDRFLFFLTGLLGCFLLFMWFGTDHRVCAWNLNLLWAFPPNVVFSFYAHRGSRGTRRYATWVILLNLFLLAGWFVLPQQLPAETIPVIVMLVVRSWQILARPRLSLR